MRQVRRFALAVSVLVLLLAGCSVSFTTAHITGFTIAKDKEAKQPAAAFGQSDPVYAKALVANVPGKVTLKWRLIAEKIAGTPEHSPLPEADTSFDLAGDGSSTYTLTPPPNGWPVGSYAIEVRMLDDTGAEKDKRSGTFTVGGTAAAAPAAATPAPAAPAAATPPAEAGHASSGAKFSEPEFSDRKHGDPTDTFAPDTEKIFLHAEFSGLAPGAKITATWIAEKAEGVAPETKIVSSDVSVSGQENQVDFSVTRPTKGWPVGDYRVDVSVDGKVLAVGRFGIDQD